MPYVEDVDGTLWLIKDSGRSLILAAEPRGYDSGDPQVPFGDDPVGEPGEDEY